MRVEEAAGTEAPPIHQKGAHRYSHTAAVLIHV